MRKWKRLNWLKLLKGCDIFKPSSIHILNRKRRYEFCDDFHYAGSGSEIFGWSWREWVPWNRNATCIFLWQPSEQPSELPINLIRSENNFQFFWEVEVDRPDMKHSAKEDKLYFCNDPDTARAKFKEGQDYSWIHCFHFSKLLVIWTF